MNDRGKAAIVIPCYNSGQYLLEAVDSALAQTYHDVECIVVNDGSTDEATINALAQLEGLARVRVVNTENCGLPAARNSGITASNAEYILPLDADDKVAPTYLAKAIAALADPSIGLAYCRAQFFGEKVGDWALPDFSWKLILLDNIIFASSVFRRQDWSAVGGYDEALRLGREDHDFNLRILGLGLMPYRIDEVLFFYRQHGRSLNSVISKDRSDLISVSARRFRNNIALYEAHADEFFAGIFDAIDRGNNLYYRYRWIESMRKNHPRLIRTAKHVRHALAWVRRLVRRTWEPTT
jgi:glycosyltransferase involved in cell wall biosynthesis